MTLIKTDIFPIMSIAPLLSCRGCGRDDLRLIDFPVDRSKPSGHHSRCCECKRKSRLPKPPPPVNVQAVIRRDAMVELVKRHRLEFDDIVSFYRSEHGRSLYGREHNGRWVNASRAVAAVPG